MTNDLAAIIQKSTFQVIPGTFLYAKVAAPPQGRHFLITQDEDEITVVTRTEQIDSLNLLERNKEDYALIALNVSVPFYSTGFLATITGAIADARLNVLVVSTYSKDYILIKQSELEEARAALLKLGFKESEAQQ